MRAKGVQWVTRMCMKYYPWDNAFPSWAARTSNQAVRRGVRAGRAQKWAEGCISMASPYCCCFLPLFPRQPSRSCPGFQVITKEQPRSISGGLLFIQYLPWFWTVCPLAETSPITSQVPLQRRRNVCGVSVWRLPRVAWARQPWPLCHSLLACCLLLQVFSLCFSTHPSILEFPLPRWVGVSNSLPPAALGLELGWQFPWGVRLPLQGLMASATPQWIWLICNPKSTFPPYQFSQNRRENIPWLMVRCTSCATCAVL